MCDVYKKFWSMFRNMAIILVVVFVLFCFTIVITVVLLYCFDLIAPHGVQFFAFFYIFFYYHVMTVLEVFLFLFLAPHCSY